MALQLTFVGTGDAFGSGGRFNTCFHLAGGTCTALIDCGASSMVALRKEGVDLGAIDVIFLSHLHGDHFGALPFFMLDAQFVTVRTKPLSIVGPPGTEERLKLAMEVFFTGSSKVPWRFGLDVIEISEGASTAVHGVTVEPFEVDHPSGAPSHALRLAIDGKIVCYSGDTAWTDALLVASAGADLFICECHSFEKDIPFHINYTTLQENLPHISAKRIVLTHMSDDMLTNLDNVDVDTANDGLVINL